MPNRFFSLIFAAMLCHAECVQVGPQGNGHIQVVAVDATGAQISNVGIELLEAGLRNSVQSEFRGNATGRLPFGIYVLRILAPGFRRIEREIRLYQTELTVWAALDVAAVDDCGGSATVRGSVNLAPGDRELWVKLVSIHGSKGSETPIGRNGHFTMAGLDHGKYLLILLDRTSAIYNETIDVLGDKSFTVNLKKR